MLLIKFIFLQLNFINLRLEVKMSCALNIHAKGYTLSKADALHCFFSCATLSAIPYALRHLELAKTQSNNRLLLGHGVLFIAECIPVIGILVAAVEYLVASHFRIMNPSNLP